MDLLKVASAGLGKNNIHFSLMNFHVLQLGLSPHHAMQIAERLYTSGYISYPRTETTQYADNADLK